MADFIPPEELAKLLAQGGDAAAKVRGVEFAGSPWWYRSGYRSCCLRAACCAELVHC